jgi:hypothetical protein
MSNDSDDDVFFVDPPPSNADPDWVEELIRQKHVEYVRNGKRYRALYYALRLSVGLAAVGALISTVSTMPQLAIVCTVAIACGLVLDQILDPRARWVENEMVSHLLLSLALERRGLLEKYRKTLDVIRQHEHTQLQRLTDVQDILRAVASASPAPPPAPRPPPPQPPKKRAES